MNTLFTYCCDVISYIAATFNISYAACNILIFLHILPAVYLFTTVIVFIFGFFKKSKVFGLCCIIGSLLLFTYEFEYLWNMLATYQLDTVSFNIAVEGLRIDAQHFNTTYEIINIIYFILVPILSTGIKIFLISTNNNFKKCG